MFRPSWYFHQQAPGKPSPPACITASDRPHFFANELVQGAFAFFRHEHHFRPGFTGQETWMTDVFAYVSPFGTLGKSADSLFLKKYLTRLLEKRKAVIKYFAETGKWQEALPPKKPQHNPFTRFYRHSRTHSGPEPFMEDVQPLADPYPAAVTHGLYS